ncbi:MAG: LysR family transcriptional regulator [Anaerovoracaceae bacterium]|nr:LysR family transcriptional regulator [Bacillota bacterium]MDY2670979.1 LysR family transcriptional regulator [Anaerovoracaceae bacterium]
MTGDKYKVLLAVLEAGSISGAAERLGYTPSGVSRMMASLEDELGLRLLERGKSGASATRECQALLPSIRSAVYYQSQSEQLAARIRGLDVGTVTIGTSYGAYYRWLAGITAEFTSAYPNIEVRFVCKNSTDLYKAIESHTVDIGIISRRDTDGVWIPLREDPMVAWVPGDSRYDRLGYVPVKAFAEEPYIEPYPGEDTDTLRYFKKHGISPNIRYTVNDTYAAFCLVEAGLGITAMNDLTKGEWNGKVSVVPVKPAETISIGITTPKDAVLPAAEKLIKFMKKKL